MQVSMWVITQCCNIPLHLPSYSHKQGTWDLRKPAIPWKIAIYYQVTSAQRLPFRIYHIRKDFPGKGEVQDKWFSVGSCLHTQIWRQDLMCYFHSPGLCFSIWLIGILISAHFSHLFQNKWMSLANSNSTGNASQEASTMSPLIVLTTSLELSILPSSDTSMQHKMTGECHQILPWKEENEKLKVKSGCFPWTQHVQQILRDKESQTMDSKHTVLSKSNHPDGCGDIIEQTQFNIAQKKEM